MNVPHSRGRPRPRRAAVLAGAATLGATVALTGAISPAFASSHREAPLTAGDPKADSTDTYAFVSPDKPDTVTLIGNWIPFEEPNGGPNYYPFATDARYNINIDNNGDGVADIVYQWTFKSSYESQSTFLYNTGPVDSLTSPNLNFRQTYTLKEIDGKGASKTLVADGKVAPSFTGKASMPNYAGLRDEAITPVDGGGKSYVGQADDPFFLDLRVFDLLYGTDLSEVGQDTLDGYDVNTIALQVPTKNLSLNKDATRNPVIGVWQTTERQATTTRSAGKQSSSGSYVQVSRLGNPLVNEVVVPVQYKDAFNGLTPNLDHTIDPVVAKVKDPEVPQLIEKIYGVKAPATPRNDLVEIFLTGICKACGPIKADLNSQMLNKDVVASKFVPAEELRLNTSIKPTAKPDRLGVLANDLQGFPNGRRLSDDVVDIELQALEGAAQTGKLVKALAKGDGVNANDHAFGKTFPYIALPNEDAVNNGAKSKGSASTNGSVTPSGGVQAGAGGTANASSDLPLLPVSVAVLGIVLAGAGVLTLRRVHSAA